MHTQTNTAAFRVAESDKKKDVIARAAAKQFAEYLDDTQNMSAVKEAEGFSRMHGYIREACERTPRLSRLTVNQAALNIALRIQLNFSKDEAIVKQAYDIATAMLIRYIAK